MNFTFLLLTLVIILGCSRSGDVILPDEAIKSSSDSLAQNQNNLAYPGVLGAWKVLLDRKNLTAEIIPARNASKIGDIFDADLSQFLTVSPCENCLAITGMRIAGDKNVHLDILMRHPFTNINARPDLHGFDVRAIFIIAYHYYSTIPLKMTKPDGSEEDIKYPGGWILNADGYTNHYVELIDDPRYFIHSEDAPANINPYLRFFESWSMGTFDPMAPTGYNVMPVGTSTYERTAVISGWTTKKMWFYIVADVAYGQSAVLANRTNPQYYLPAFNRTEPWRVEYWIENNNLTYNDPNSTADVVVQVFDWQHGATVDPSYPNPSNLSGIRESSKVASLELNFPYMMNNPVVATIPEAGTGTPSDPLRYRFTVRNELQYPASQVDGFIAVRDQLHGAVSPSGRIPIPVSPSGFPYETLDIRDYSYYGDIRINIPNLSYSVPYKGELWLTSSNLFDDWEVSIDATFFMDDSHKKFQYRWDFDYDGVTFDLDGGGLPSPYIDLSTPGKKNIALRVRTNSVPPREYIYEMAAYGPGLADEERINNNGLNFTTSSRGQHAVALNDDIFYIAYVSKESGGENIFLALYKDGELIRNTQITYGADYLDPAIAIIPSGAHAGVYIAYIEYVGAPEIYVSWGNLDGTGFDPSHLSWVPHVQYETDPCLIYNNDILYCIFQETKTSAPTYSRIASVRSTDFAQTWVDRRYVQNTTDYQYNPAVTLDEQRVYCVWEDGRNDATLGTDLYIARSDDCLYWSIDGNLLNTTQNIDEYSPSISNAGEKIAVVYVSQHNGYTYADVRIHVIGYSGSIDMVLEDSSGDNIATNPTVDVVNIPYYHPYYLVSYSVYNTATGLLKSKTRCYSDRNGWDLLNEIFWIDEEVGTITPAAGGRTYAGVACQSVAGGNAIEHYIVRRTFEDGFETDGAEYYGKIDILWYISDGNDQY